MFKRKRKVMTEDMKIGKISRQVEDARKWTIDDTEDIVVHQMERQKKAFIPKSKKESTYKMDRKSRKFIKKDGDKTYLITIKFKNGTRKTFAIKTDTYTFKIKKKIYYLYWEEAWYDLSMNQYHLDFIEDCPVPINREIVYQGEEAFHSVTPENLEGLIKFEYIKTLTSSHKLDATLRTILVLTFIILIGVVLNILLVWANNRGA